jgi:nitrate reductase gamma subunit
MEQSMYELVTGPLAWVAFSVFILGLTVRLVWYIKGLNWQMDRVTYNRNVTYGIRGAARSVVRWLIPYGTHSWRYYAGFTALVFIFHIGLIVTPIFLLAHNIMLQGSWGFHLPSLPEAVNDALTIAVLIAAVFILLRRIALPEVRILTTAYDIVLLLIVVAPFFTGFVAYHQLGNYDGWLIAHILSGEIMLMAIPLTKLSHALLFFLSRAQLGMDFGVKRGGMKSPGLPW